MNDGQLHVAMFSYISAALLRKSDLQILTAESKWLKMQSLIPISEEVFLLEITKSDDVIDVVTIFFRPNTNFFFKSLSTICKCQYQCALLT